MFQLNVFLIRLFPYLILQSRSEAAVRMCSWKFCKIHSKTFMLESLFSKVAHVLSYDFREIFKNTIF